MSSHSKIKPETAASALAKVAAKVDALQASLQNLEAAGFSDVERIRDHLAAVFNMAGAAADKLRDPSGVFCVVCGNPRTAPHRLAACARRCGETYAARGYAGTIRQTHT